MSLEAFKHNSSESHPLRNDGLERNKHAFLNHGHKSDTKRTVIKHRFMGVHYRKAKVYKGSTGKASEAWHVFYFYLDPTTGKMVRFKVYEGINRIKSPIEKERFATELCAAVNQGLADGFNPFELEKNRVEVIRDIVVVSETPKPPRLTEAFEMFLNAKRSKNVAKATIQSYQSFINAYEQWLIDNQIADIRINEVDTGLIKRMLDDIGKKLNGTTYNNYLNFWITLINWFAKKPRNWVDRNHFDIGQDGEIEEKVTRPMKHQYFGDTIFNKVKEAMKPFPQLLFYSKFIFFSCMRPDEIRNLKVENIDITGRYIKIVGKTKSRTIPICDELAEMLNSLEVHKIPASWYIIGKDGPGPRMHSEGHFARLFRDEIRTPLGLSKDFTLYGMKHTRVVTLLNAGYSDAEVMNLTGHHDTASYDKYKRDLVNHIDTRLKGKTVEF